MRAQHTIDQVDVPTSSATRPWWRAAVAELAPLWVGGVALLCLALVHLAGPAFAVVSPRAPVWALYLALGTLFPAVVAVVMFSQGSRPNAPIAVVAALVLLPIAATVVFAGPLHSVIAVGLALLQTGICVVVAGWRRMPVRIEGVRRTSNSVSIEFGGGSLDLQTNHVLSLFVMAFIAWSIVLEMLTWWKPFTDRLLDPPWRLLLVGAVALLACCWWAFATVYTASGSSKQMACAVDAVCLVFLVLLAFRTDGLFTTDRLGDAGTYYHWGVFVGPAEAVRQGGWLLWDVPFQYGFLSTLALAALPTPTTWQSLYLLSAIGSALLAISFYFVVRVRRPGVPGVVFAFLVATAVVFLLSNWPPSLTPPHYHPSAGAFRFGWCYLLVGLLLLERRVEPRTRSQQAVLLAGCLVWLLSMLWSVESAFYGTAIWIPAFAVIVMRDHGGLQGARHWRAVGAWLAVPLVLLAGAAGGTVLIYQRFLGHGPDVRGFVDLALAFSADWETNLTRMVAGTDLNRTIVVVLFGFLLLAMTAAAIARRHDGLRNLPLALALAYGTWAIASYAAGLPTPYAIYRLMPFIVIGLGIVLAFFASSDRPRSDEPWANLVRTGTIAILTSLLITAYMNVSDLQYYARAVRAEGFHGRDVTAGLPRVDASLASLLAAAKATAADPIFYAGARFGDLMPVWTSAGEGTPVVVSRQWMPGPLGLVAYFAYDRKQLYMARFSEREHEGGWLIERRLDGEVVDQDTSLDPWFFEQVDRSHVPTGIAQNADWQMVWYEPRNEPNAAALGGSRTGRVPGLPSDLLINGQSLADSVLPPVWGYFGPEWTDPASDRLPRCTDKAGTLYLFTPSPLNVQVSLRPSASGFDAPLQVAVNNGEPVEAAARDQGSTARARVSLDQGWNVLTIGMAGVGQPVIDTMNGAGGCEAADPEESLLRLKTVDVHFGSGANGRE